MIINSKEFNLTSQLYVFPKVNTWTEPGIQIFNPKRGHFDYWESQLKEMALTFGHREVRSKSLEKFTGF